jgi:hypothetical protein
MAEEKLKSGILDLIKNMTEIDEPEPKCNICGRIIFCGVDELCKEDPCGLKGK